MTNAEAIEILRKKIVPCVKHSAWEEAVNMAIAALEKQEGKKPKIVGETEYSFFVDCCPCCGQKILWE